MCSYLKNKLFFFFCFVFKANKKYNMTTFQLSHTHLYIDKRYRDNPLYNNTSAMKGGKDKVATMLIFTCLNCPNKYNDALLFVLRNFFLIHFFFSFHGICVLHYYSVCNFVTHTDTWMVCIIIKMKMNIVKVNKWLIKV